MTQLKEFLSRRLNRREIERIVVTAELEELYQLIFNDKVRVACNALWVMTHLSREHDSWIAMKRTSLIDMLLSESHTGKKRMLLALLNRLKTEKGEIRTDYLDYCFSKINSTEPYGIRALALKQAYAQALHYPQLISEFRLEIEGLRSEPLSPGLKSALNQITRKLGDESGARN